MHELINLIISDFKLKDCQNLLTISEAFFNTGRESVEIFLESIGHYEKNNKITVTTIHQAKGRE